MKFAARLTFAIFHPLTAARYFFRFLKISRLKPPILKNFLVKSSFRPVFFNSDIFFSTLSAQEIRESADRICLHQFDLLGSGIKDLGEKIPWRQDFKTGKQWPLEHFDKIRAEAGADIKVPWELSRFYHTPLLGKAYFLTGNEKYAIELINQILDWQKENPPYLGPNWANAMESGIRACNLLLSYYLTKTSAAFSTEFKNKFSALIYQHAYYILNNLENILIKSNHYLSDLTGLLYIGLLMPELKISQKCLKFSLKALEEEIRSQVYEDGADFEASISYHRLVTELFAFSGLLCRLNQIDLSNYFWQKLKKMFEFTLNYLKPNGLAPQIGDNDDGRLHLVFENYYSWDKRNHKHLLILANELFSNQAWLTPLKTTISFKNAGIYLMKNKNFYILANVSPVGQNNNGGHSHNDKLSFELNYQGEDFLIDPGAYIYTPEPEQRNYFRSTQKHNNLRIDGQEQNDFIEGSLFSLKNQTKVRVLSWQSEDDFDSLSAEHYGYSKLKNPVTHRREFLFNKQQNNLKIKDILLGKGEHLLEWFFNFADGVEVKKQNQSLILEKNQRRLILNLPQELNIEVFNDFVSPSYGVKVQSKSCRAWLKTDISRVNTFGFEVHPA